MTVKEMIEKLQTYPQNMRVVDDISDDFDETSFRIEEVWVQDTRDSGHDEIVLRIW